MKNIHKLVKTHNLLRKACKDLKKEKPITCYSFKRNGVTFARQRGESDLEIQHRARWTSAKQLKTYDLSTQEDSFKIALVKRGLIKEKKHKDFFPKTKTFVYCGFDKIGFTEVICPKCSHIIGRDKIKENIRAGEALKNYFDIKQIQDLFN